MSDTRPALTLTLDLEDHRQGADPARRYQDNARRILDRLEQLGIRATVFIVGDLIDECRELLRVAAVAGHELALHSTTHTPLTSESAKSLAPGLAAARARLEDLAGSAVTGFRAPVFSLTPASAWVTELLSELGFRYSSSVLPAANPLYGYPGAPQVPFRWPSGLIELPVPLGRIGPLTLPFLGGIYLRYLPLTLINRMSAALQGDALRWSYVHPYDIDHEEGFFRFPGTTFAQSLLLWRRRRGTLRRLGALIDERHHSAGAPLAERAAQLEPMGLPAFNHGAVGAVDP